MKKSEKSAKKVKKTGFLTKLKKTGPTFWNVFHKDATRNRFEKTEKRVFLGPQKWPVFGHFLPTFYGKCVRKVDISPKVPVFEKKWKKVKKSGPDLTNFQNFLKSHKIRLFGVDPKLDRFWLKNRLQNGPLQLTPLLSGNLEMLKTYMPNLWRCASESPFKAGQKWSKNGPRIDQKVVQKLTPKMTPILGGSKMQVHE